MNVHVERFNRTLQEEFLDYHEELLMEPAAFNRELIPWLLWYNEERPHWGLELKSPVQFLMEQRPEECKMWWPNTGTCYFMKGRVCSLHKRVPYPSCRNGWR